MPTELEFKITPREELAGYERIDIDRGAVRVGHARVRFVLEKVVIYHVQIFPEFQKNGYGAAVIELLKTRFEVLVADRVQYTARGFWEHMGFVDGNDGNWIWRRTPSLAP